MASPVCEALHYGSPVPRSLSIALALIFTQDWGAKECSRCIACFITGTRFASQVLIILPTRMATRVATHMATNVNLDKTLKSAP